MQNFDDPTQWPLSTWLLALIMSCAGGIVNWIALLKKGKKSIRVFSFTELMGELFISGFTGIIMFMWLSSYDYPIGFCAASAGICGHMATRLLFILENRIYQIIKIKELTDESDR